MTSFTHILLAWFRENGRELPWRETHDPYAIWLSEIILQQTQVKQGWSYWERFMRRWPTVDALAAASEDEVLREWQGLGYYSRARNLHFAAKQIVAMGGFPHTLDEIKSLKGVGDYTAAAIGSIAFGLPAAVVDGNVYRVLSRYFGVETPINTTEGKKTFTALAQSLLPPKEASAYNQAIMDFGAIQCTPQSPQCGSCPLQESCVAFREDRVGTLPVKLKTLKVKERRLSYVYIRCKGYVAIHRRGAGDIWQGLYEPYLVAEDNNGIDLQQCLLLKKDVRHVLTHRILLADFYLLETAVRPELAEDYIWVQEQDLEKYGVPRLVELLYEEVRAVLGNRK
ncbi:A/G-specific adenine glycosylase [Xylanibacter brevis]|uniref:A/G-specific adenine glycosylase n=1 Tax=Xylanibacter brevis TaxID=83231 RepID=UPI000481C4A7|nr:A/G-specific adenine glycosylase [Xylanibacter brevis]